MAVPVIPVSGRWKREDPRESLASRSNLKKYGRQAKGLAWQLRALGALAKDLN